MKKLPSVKGICIALIVISLIQVVSNRVERLTILSLDSTLTTRVNPLLEAIMLKSSRESLQQEEKNVKKDTVIKQEIEIVSLKAATPVIVYDGMTMEELTNKLNLSLKSSLSGYGSSFANYAIQYGVDPYLALAITLHETGCNWTCSSLVQSCNNVGGMKGSGGCGSYAKFDSLDAGIEAMISNLARNYIQKGLTTPETIGPKYAASATWSSKINYYIEQIKNA